MDRLSRVFCQCQYHLENFIWSGPWLGPSHKGMHLQLCAPNHQWLCSWLALKHRWSLKYTLRWGFYWYGCSKVHFLTLWSVFTLLKWDIKCSYFVLLFNERKLMGFVKEYNLGSLQLLFLQNSTLLIGYFHLFHFYQAISSSNFNVNIETKVQSKWFQVCTKIQWMCNYHCNLAYL